jgi:hypothetical protein
MTGQGTNPIGSKKQLIGRSRQDCPRRICHKQVVTVLFPEETRGRGDPGVYRTNQAGSLRGSYRPGPELAAEDSVVGGNAIRTRSAEDRIMLEHAAGGWPAEFGAALVEQLAA